MPKQKSNSSAKRRFKILSGGRIKHACSGKAHKANGKGKSNGAHPKRRKTIRNLNKGGYVSNNTESKTIRLLVGKGGR